MDPKAKAALLEFRLQKLMTREKDNQGVCRRIRRQLRNLKKESNAV